MLNNFTPPFTLPRKPGLFRRLFAGPQVAAWIGRLDAFFIKLPHLPKKLRLIISKIVPWLALGLGLIGALASLITGFFLILALLAWDTSIFWELGGSLALVLLSTLFLLKAFKPLRAGNAVGWIYLFWAQALELLNFLLRVIAGDSNLLAGLVSLLLAYYLLFEIGQFYVYKKADQGETNS